MNHSWRRTTLERVLGYHVRGTISSPGCSRGSLAEVRVPRGKLTPYNHMEHSFFIENFDNEPKKNLTPTPPTTRQTGPLETRHRRRRRSAFTSPKSPIDLWGRRGGSAAAGGLISGEAGGLGGVRAGCAGGVCEGGVPGRGSGRGEAPQWLAAGLVGWEGWGSPWLEEGLPCSPVVRPCSWAEGCR